MESGSSLLSGDEDEIPPTAKLMNNNNNFNSGDLGASHEDLGDVEDNLSDDHDADDETSPIRAVAALNNGSRNGRRGAANGSAPLNGSTSHGNGAATNGNGSVVVGSPVSSLAKAVISAAKERKASTTIATVIPGSRYDWL